MTSARSDSQEGSQAPVLSLFPLVKISSRGCITTDIGKWFIQKVLLLKLKCCVVDINIVLPIRACIVVCAPFWMLTDVLGAFIPYWQPINHRWPNLACLPSSSPTKVPNYDPNIDVRWYQGPLISAGWTAKASVCVQLLLEHDIVHRSRRHNYIVYTTPMWWFNCNHAIIDPFFCFPGCSGTADDESLDMAAALDAFDSMPTLTSMMTKTKKRLLSLRASGGQGTCNTTTVSIATAAVARGKFQLILLH